MNMSLSKLGVDSRTYVPLSNKDSTELDRAEYKNTNLDIEVCYKYYERFIFHLKHSSITKNILSKYNFSNFDFVQAYSLFSNGYVAMKIKKETGLNYSVIVQNTDVNIFFKKMIYLRKLGVDILRNASSIVFISQAYKKKVLDNYITDKYRKEIEEKSYYIPFGVDNFWIDNICNRDVIPNFADKKLKIIFAGRIRKNKNATNLAKACEVLNNQGYNIKLTVVGQHEDKNIVAELQKYSFVNMIEFVQKEKLIQLYREHDIFAMTSFTESFGLVYAEALTQGLPVIYSRSEGFDMQFENGQVGYAVDPHDYNDIAENIKKICLNYKDISQEIIRNNKRFAWANIASEYKSMYQNLLK